MPESGASSKMEFTVEECRLVIGELVTRAGYGNERLIVTRYGKPVAAIVPLTDLAKLEGAA